MKKILKLVVIILVVILIVLVVLNAVTDLELKTEVVFDAPKEKVWQALTDSEKYPEWNPFITSMKGEMGQGEQLTNVMVNQGKETTFTPIITNFKEYESFEWLGSGLGGMFKGNHYFHISELEDGKTHMLHGEKFSGLLSGLIIQMIGEDTHTNFERMNEAMKKQVEKAE